MIKYVNRIIYALLIAMGLMLVYNLTDTYARTLYLEEQGQIALENNDLSYFISVRFYDATPVHQETVTVGDVSIDLYIYQGAYVQATDSGYTVVDGLYVLMHQTAGAALTDFFTVRFTSNNVVTQDFMGVRIAGLPLYSVIEENTHAALIKKSLFDSDGVYQTITNMTIFQETDVFASIPLSIDNTQFTVKAAIEDYMINNHGDVPDQSFGEVTMAPVIEIDTRSLVFRNIAIYIVVAVGVTYWIFKARKNLGKKEPTVGVQQDIEKLGEQHRKER